ncbi:glycoside hydrolase superfamily [Gorgonomyces haynaldii]|nr:glycoside hydrolase superfamily [Gorgonomyces haynaldii]
MLFVSALPQLQFPPANGGSGVPPVPANVSNTLPSNFLWGMATAAFQVEGATKEDGRTDSVWDTYSRAGRIDNNDNADISADQYHLYPQDIQLMKEYGIKAYRMSLSWSRIIPQGRKGTPVNQLAIDHYNKVFNMLLDNGITPLVTLFHWDVHQSLEDAYGAYLDTEKFPEDFVYYADTVFNAFGDRVKDWLTVNEPLTYCILGYSYNGPMAPGRCSDRSVCPKGDQATEPWLCGHSSLLAHAYTADLYHTKYKNQGGRISLALNSDWAEPLTDSPSDIAAAQRKRDFMLGWFADPIYKTGDYPQSMRDQLGNRLPKFTPEQSQLLLKSSDYFGLNHYTAFYVTDLGSKPYDNVDGYTSTQFTDKNGNQIGARAQSTWLYNVPWGFNKLLLYIKDRYNSPEILVTENGFSCPNESSLPIDQAVHDKPRVDYYQGYLNAMMDAISKGTRVIGYTAWSLVDNFEWARGYTERFGVTYVDFKTQKRYAKDSGWYLSSFFNQAVQSDKCAAQ